MACRVIHIGLRLFFLLFTINCYSQHLPITVYSPRDGAPVIGANSVFQDNAGWIWFTTGDDVYRYDGHRFNRLLPARGVTVKFTQQVLAIRDKIVVLADPVNLEVRGDSLVRVSFDPGGVNPLNRFFYDGKEFILGRKGIYSLENNRLLPHAVDSSLNIAGASVLPWQNDLFIACQKNKYLLLFNGRKKRIIKAELPVLDIQRDPGGAILLLLADGLYRLADIIYSKDGFIPKTELVFSFKGHSIVPYEFAIDQHGNYWISELHKRLIRINAGGSLNEFSESEGLPSLWFNQLLVDKENNLWLAMNGSIARINSYFGDRFTKNEGLYSNHINFITGTPNIVYIGTYTGVNAYRDGKIFALRAGDSAFHCSQLLFVPGGTFFIKDANLYSCRIDTQSFRVKDEQKLGSFSSQAFKMAAGPSGSIFIATREGIYRWKDKLEKVIDDNTYYIQLYVDSRNRLWTGAFGGGLACYSLSTGKPVLIKQFDHNLNSPSSMSLIRAIDETGSGGIMVGTRFNGLFLISEGKSGFITRRFSTDDGLSANSVWDVIKGTGRDLWVITTTGLDKLIPDNGQWKIVNESNRLQVFTGFRLFIDAGQALWVSSHPGLLRFPNEAQLPASPFQVSINAVSMDGKPVDLSDERLYFSHRQNNIAIQFSANTFLDEKRVLFSYRLLQKGKGEWSKPENIHAISFPALKPGSYAFEVRAINTLGSPSTNTASVHFDISPPVWQRAWFIIIAALLAVLLVFMAHRYRLRQVMKLQEIRNSISRNLHDDIGASLSTINILNEMAGRNIHQPQLAHNYLVKAGDDIQRISESLSDIVWNINPRYDQLSQLLVRMKRYAADMLEGRGIACELRFPDDTGTVSMTMDKRRDLYLIFKEAINNLAKYSHATEALIEIKFRDNNIFLSIQDNGTGFNPTLSNGGNGLTNMAQRAEKWKARLDIRSAPGKGTRIHLEMKA